MNISSGVRKSSYTADSPFHAYKQNPNEALRNQIAESYLHIARIIALRFSGKGIEYDDLYQVASLALLKAVERFDPDVGVLFQSYATPKMVGEVKNYFRDKLHVINMPRKSNTLVKSLESARSELSQKLLRSPSFQELVDYTHLPETEIIEALAMQGAMYPSSLDNQIGDGESSFSAIVGEEDREYNQFELRESMQRLMERLDETAKRILHERYFNERSQREVAEEMGVSQMTISRAERRALKQIREMMEAE
ncbi:sigma-70 family RNA polymerase sigma factor [Eubacteriales bacterium OttesenSCG-928-N13]|nr:sigma-70 family RNA polymerase sigma factor [Eubacteriales bacterium OttesenSCG-928-N13]